MPFIACTIHCLLSVHFFCWFEAIWIVTWRFQCFLLKNYHFLISTCEQENDEEGPKLVLNIIIWPLRVALFICCSIFPSIGRNMRKDLNQVTFQTKQNFLIISIVSILWTRMCPWSRLRKCTKQNILEVTKWITKAKRVDEKPVSTFVGINQCWPLVSCILFSFICKGR